MRAVAAFLLAAGCYSPSFPPNVPCDPAAPHCPTGQQCIGIAGAAMCSGGLAIDAPLLPSIDASAIDASNRDASAIDARLLDAMLDAPVDGPPISIDAMADAMADAMLTPLHIDYPATVADCLDPTQPDTAKCTSKNGPAQLVVDAMDSMTNKPWQSYVRFDLDGQLTGRTVTAVSLILVATNDSHASGPNSGAAWTVSAFTHASLSMMVPMQLAMVAPAQGSVTQLQTVTWPLAPTVVAANQPVYLGLISTQSDGVNYWNLTGPNPPILHVDAQ